MDHPPTQRRSPPRRAALELAPLSLQTVQDTGHRTPPRNRSRGVSETPFCATFTLPFTFPSPHQEISGGPSPAVPSPSPPPAGVLSPSPGPPPASSNGFLDRSCEISPATRPSRAWSHPRC